MSSFVGIKRRGIHLTLPQVACMRFRILTEASQRHILKQNETLTLYNPFSYIVAYDILSIFVASEFLQSIHSITIFITDVCKPNYEQVI